MLVVCLNVIAEGGGSNLFPPEQLSTFTPQDIEERIKGSKIVIVSEQVGAQRKVFVSEDRSAHLVSGNAQRHLHRQNLHALSV